MSDVENGMYKIRVMYISIPSSLPYCAPVNGPMAPDRLWRKLSRRARSTLSRFIPREEHTFLEQVRRPFAAETSDRGRNVAIRQFEKGMRFRRLHEAPDTFVIPNPWDAGTARMLTSLGFKALTTTSAGLAFTLGRPDGMAGLEATLANARAIVDATDLPVAADLENGFGHSPDDAAETIRRAGLEAGLVGGSIEDASGDPSRPIYELSHAVERVAAAVEAARRLPFPFIFVARAENYLHGRPDLDDTIRRLQAFEAAGADALYAPGITTPDEIRAVCSSLSKPVNVLAGLRNMPVTVAELAALGVRRISIGSALTRVALGAFHRAAREIASNGTFAFDEALPFADVNAMMVAPSRAVS